MARDVYAVVNSNILISLAIITICQPCIYIFFSNYKIYSFWCLVICIASVLQLFINLEYKVNNFYGRSKLLKLVDVYAHFSYLICLVLSFHYLLVLPFFKNAFTAGSHLGALAMLAAVNHFHLSQSINSFLVSEPIKKTAEEASIFL